MHIFDTITEIKNLSTHVHNFKITNLKLKNKNIRSSIPLVTKLFI